MSLSKTASVCGLQTQYWVLCILVSSVSQVWCVGGLKVITATKAWLYFSYC